MRGYHSHFSRTIASAKNLTEAEGAHTLTSQMREFGQVKRYYNKLIDATIELQDIDPSNIDVYGEELDKDRVRFDEISVMVAKRLALASNGQRNHSPIYTNETPKTFRINEALKPDILNKDATPLELRQWMDSFEAYYASNKMESLTIIEQQAKFHPFPSSREILQGIRSDSLFRKARCLAGLSSDRPR
ncbi:Hypothetical predicted protein [Paramuricea clavata]|uniref:Uncharacterized protein n=1 Tax=Paramuricea clavata TaxID=317549 RepID=A0A7D9MHM5_PARCT|nr:Hypothetical predicted protein [Paramuricea clavata]